MSHALKREDIAALVVVSDPSALLTHGLNVNHMDLKWILREKPPELIAANPSSQRRRDPQQEIQPSSSARRRQQHQQEEKTVGGDELGLIAGTGELVLVSATGQQQNDTRHERETTQPADQDEDKAKISGTAEEESPSNIDTAAAANTTAESSTSRRRRGLRTLTTLDHLSVCPPPIDTSTGKHSVLLDSPRSVFIVLSNGHSVEALCHADSQIFYNEALRTGVPLEMVNLRIQAENKRRAQRYFSLRDAYIKLCHRVSSDDVVQAIREHKFGIEIDAAKNRQRMAGLPRFAYNGGEDLGLLDEDCQRVLDHSRSKTVEEIRRVLEQREKKSLQRLEYERKVLQESSSFDAERRAMELKEKDQRERSLSIQKRADEFRNRIQRIREEQSDEIEDLRRKVEVKEQENEDFRYQQELLRRSQSTVAAEAQQLKRESIKQQVQEREEQRRRELVQRAEYLTKLHQRDLERKREQKLKESKELREINEGRARAIRIIGVMQLEEKRLKSQEAIERSNERAEEFKKIRSMRLEARRKLVEERAERGALARKAAEEKRARKAAEVAEEYEKKQMYIQEMVEEHEQQLTLQKELSKQSRMVQVEEQKRCQSVTQFHSIGYLADAQAKAAWLERENKKRELLSSQVRMEREALQRARDIVLLKAEEEEIQRRKDETFQRLNATV